MMPRPYKDIFLDFPEILRSILDRTWKLPTIHFGLSFALLKRFFSDNLSQKNSIYHLFFSEGMVTNPAILLIIDAVRIFPTLPTSTVLLERAAGNISSFVANFRKFISFCRLGSIFTQIISKKIKPINKLLILSFSLSQITLFACKKNGFEMNFGNKYVIKWVDVRPKNRL